MLWQQKQFSISPQEDHRGPAAEAHPSKLNAFSEEISLHVATESVMFSLCSMLHSRLIPSDIRGSSCDLMWFYPAGQRKPTNWYFYKKCIIFNTGAYSFILNFCF